MTHQHVADGAALAKLLDQIPRKEQIDFIGWALLHKSSLRTQWNKLRTLLVGNLFVLPEIVPVDAIASSRSIYATRHNC
ncbi:MAG: hypothetical protein E5299_02316 [Burkholderia gladioli]|nr:MAG: hypothetical protein E5299_02316 [Burkholderia gladioli]